MFHKIIFLFAFTLFTSILFAQQNQKTDTTTINWYDYGMRIYDPTPCSGCPANEKYKKLPQQFIESPYKYNDIKPIALPDSLINFEWLWLLKKEEPICL